MCNEHAELAKDVSELTLIDLGIEIPHEEIGAHVIRGLAGSLASEENEKISRNYVARKNLIPCIHTASINKNHRVYLIDANRLAIQLDHTHHATRILSILNVK